ncbi:MAG: YidB family protein [Hydrogenophaga sp.]|uniref:YidB family protein n=1 Tax=Hydrogenophaga sp. TaxID=1904254 RepID=UPI0027178C24|nr:YidB family protein [Hydrogenophaga sp.]MDO9032137.1 YidB family protein [Hydrogenophaga sp.]
MGLLDSLVGAALGGGQGGQAQTGTGGLDPQVLMGIVTALMNNGGGLSGILAKLQQGGLGDAAQSWVGTGVNQPVSPDALGGALGPDLMGMIARQLGGNQQQAAGTLADLLPGLIDQLTPQGRLPTDNGQCGLGALLGGGDGRLDAGDLMGMLGGLMRK